MGQQVDRRTFHKAGAAGVAAALGVSSLRAEKVDGASSRIRVGVIGVGMRGTQLIKAIQEHKDAQIVALCDVYEPHLAKGAAMLPEGIDLYSDFRKVIDRQDIDAVVLATPDHWHAIQTIMACESGKDVYVEKPLSATIAEGRRMVNAARQHGRVVQVGTHRRSATLWQKTAQIVQGNSLGHLSFSRAARITNMAPKGIGKLEPSSPPAGLDWDMWLGPRAAIPYQANITPYKFRWWKQFSSQMGNWGVHYFDAIRWCLGNAMPSSVCAMGGKFAVDDDRSIPDTATAMFQFDSGHLLQFSTLESSGNLLLPAAAGAEIEMRGTEGTLYMGGQELHVLPERPGQFQERGPRAEPLELTVAETNHDQTTAHFRNFFDCIASRALPAADVEIGHHSTTMALLANLSLETGSRLEWDAENERVTNLPAANELLDYEYRAPWKA